MARLPTPGSDDNIWGDVLNDYLQTSHNADGTIKNNTVTGATIADDAIVETKLASAVRTKLNQTAPVQSVAGKTGAVTLTKSDVGLSNVDNTSDSNKPISNDTQAALNAKAGIFYRTWNGTAWSARPVTPANVPVVAYSTQDQAAPEPPNAQVGDIWERHPQAS